MHAQVARSSPMGSTNQPGCAQAKNEGVLYVWVGTLAGVDTPDEALYGRPCRNVWTGTSLCVDPPLIDVSLYFRTRASFGRIVILLIRVPG